MCVMDDELQSSHTASIMFKQDHSNIVLAMLTSSIVITVESLL